jgi:hypothetical protein
MISFFFLETAYSSIKRNSKLCSSSVGVPRRPQLQRRGRECTTVGSNGGRA